ncbi:hypothetical protein N8T08_004201, partial [Aspergillus melleus]
QGRGHAQRIGQQIAPAGVAADIGLHHLDRRADRNGEHGRPEAGQAPEQHAEAPQDQAEGDEMRRLVPDDRLPVDRPARGEHQAQKNDHQGGADETEKQTHAVQDFPGEAAFLSARDEDPTPCRREARRSSQANPYQRQPLRRRLAQQHRRSVDQHHAKGRTGDDQRQGLEPGRQHGRGDLG